MTELKKSDKFKDNITQKDSENIKLPLEEKNTYCRFTRKEIKELLDCNCPGFYIKYRDKSGQLACEVVSRVEAGIFKLTFKSEYLSKVSIDYKNIIEFERNKGMGGTIPSSKEIPYNK